MTSLRTQAPPVNLKERIAALQQKNVSSQSQRPTSPPLTSPNSVSGSGSAPQSNVAALREKIAKFEKKGGIPVPRGSFGLGAPPPDRGQKKSGELYGNRIPTQTTGNGGYIKPQYTGGSFIQQQLTGPAGSSSGRSPSPFSDDKPTPRSFSSSSTNPLPSPPLEPLKPIHTGRRGTEFAKAMELARKAEADSQIVYDPRLRETSTSPTPASMPPPIIANRRFSSFLDDPPTIIVSPQFESDFEEASDPVTFSEPETFGSTAEQGEEEEDVSAQDTDDSIPSAPFSSSNRSEEYLPVSSTSVSEEPVAASFEATIGLDDSISTEDIQSTPEKVGSSSLPVEVPLETNKVEDLHETASQVVEEPFTITETSVEPIASEVDLPITPVTPLTFEVHSLISIQDPETPKPLASPTEDPASSVPSSSEQTKILSSTAAVVDRDDLPVEPLSSLTATQTKAESEASEALLAIEERGTEDNDSLDGDDLEDNLPESPLFTRPKPLVRDQPITAYNFTGIMETEFSSPSLAAPSLPPTPAAARGSFPPLQTVEIPSRRSSYTESSPGHLTLAHRISPITSRGIPVFIRGTAPPNIDIVDHDADAPSEPQRPKTAVPSAWSDTISPEGVEFGVVTIDNGTVRKRPVPTMVHPRSFSSSYTEPDFNPAFDRNQSHTFNAVVHGKTRETFYESTTLPRANTVVGTPQRRNGRPSTLEEPMSPSFGDLALLVEQSAMLERRLLNGELPDETEMASRKGLVSAPARAETGVGLEERTRMNPKGVQDEQELRRRPSTKSMKSRASSDSKRTRKPSFSLRNPLSRSKSTNRKDDESEMGETNRSKSMYLTSSSQPSLSTIPPLPALPPTQTVTVAPSIYSDDIPPTPPPKSPSAKYLSSFRRFASTRSHGNGVSRHSVSMSSEISSSDDSVAVQTPPDNSPGFADSGSGFCLRTGR
ncbi:hypothetical protein BT96DRAFT_539601 [Gymnopus androsaceus JB14]|uniref:Uncharacterized protein n=1 Tax=Gymnopus androsaceus JB14 TaxID=1447944 RepID=A0A6A4GM45_9AGAR|nr:hypothetical protein BT96DRAFT_539601 [Gymnopus androsaceus JB14]